MMEIKDFNADLARYILRQWQRHLGFFPAHNIPYLRQPELLVSAVKERLNWSTGMFEQRMGSRWLADSRLAIYYGKADTLEIECYSQADKISAPQARNAVQKAEGAFNDAMRTYLETYTKK